MENATKALIMAGTVLISILLISFLVLFLRKGASASAEYHNTMSDAELAKFNSQFEVYDRKNNTYFDMITVANMVYDVNKKNQNDEQNQIEFTLHIPPNIEFKILKNHNNLKRNCFFLNSDNKQISMYNYQINGKRIVNLFTEIDNNTKKYRCLFICNNIVYSEITGRVESIKFSIKNEQ